MYVAADPLLTSGTMFGTYEVGETLLTRQIPYGAPFYARGRVALWAALGAMGISAGDGVLLPSFICDSVLGPIEALGAKPEFFSISESLEIDLDRLRRAFTARSRAVLVPHYYGMPMDLDSILSFCAEHNLWLIEDCAHALFSFDGETPLGRRGHAAIFSPWKSLPIPDGGVLVLNDSRLLRPDPLPEHGALALAREMTYRVLPTIETALGWSPRLKLLQREQLRDSMQERDRNPSFARISGSDFSYQLMERANGPQIRKKRRSNYQRLALAVAAQPYLQALWPRLSDGVCPLGLPIRCSEREGARRHFLDRGINVRAYWEQLPREVSTHEHPAAHQLSQEILILPVHQSMTQRQIEHVVRAIEELPGGVAA